MPRRPIAHGHLPLSVLLVAAIGCAGSIAYAPSDLRDVVKGPDAVFESVDDAAMDALAFCFMRNRGDRWRGRVRGGTIHPTAGGYTYSAVATADHRDPHRVYFHLPPEAVASFRHLPRTGEISIDKSNESHSKIDRRVVDELDPLHRHSYLLTPSKTVRVYGGNGYEWVIARLDEWADAKRRARVRVVTIEED